MNQSMKAALLSGLVFPGMGHIFLNRHKRGAAIIVTSVACFVVMVVNVVQQTFKVLEKFQLEGGVIDLDKITELVAQSTSHSSNLFFNLALILMIISWIFGIVDAYNIGKNK